ncbi:MAG: Wzz/FepE/Etk N-terminal domain-containing protein, partial [Rubrobacteraceae bacterium]
MKSTNQQDWRSERSEGLGISEVLNAVWGRKIVIVGIVVVLTLFSVSYALIREPAYTVEAVVQVSPQGSPQG